MLQSDPEFQQIRKSHRLTGTSWTTFKMEHVKEPFDNKNNIGRQ